MGEGQFREEAMEAERARQSRLNAKSVIIEENFIIDNDSIGSNNANLIDVGEEAKRIKEQKEAERKAALAKAEAEREEKKGRGGEEEDRRQRGRIEERSRRKKTNGRR